MEATQKTSFWKRMGITLQQYSEAMDYGIYDIVEEQAKRLKSLEGDVTALRAEIKLLKGAFVHSCSAKN